VKLIDRLIKTGLRKRQLSLHRSGMTEEAKQSRKLASKYTEMKYNGHTHSLRMEINDKWKTK
jgi:hypothetical protein